jgi:hypothetical protein
MSIRQMLNEKPALAYAVAVGLVLLAAAFIAYQLIGSSNATSRAAESDQAFFSDDDGATYFPDAQAKIPPFNHQGRLAYRAIVFRCGSDKPFVGYLGKFTETKKKEMEAVAKAGGMSPRILRASMGQMLIKKPGPGKWVSPDDGNNYEKAQTVSCPKGDVPDVVTPANP